MGTQANAPMLAATKGAACGLAAAALFGLSAPFAKVLLTETHPQILAGLLYLGAGLGLSLYRGLRPATAEAPIERGDWPRLFWLTLAGGVVGPLLMLFGLERTSAISGSLLLNLEAPFTIAIAVMVFREHLGRYAAAAILCVLVGAATLKLESGPASLDALGALLIAGACLAWAIDNNITQRLSLRDPFALVQLKTLAAGAFNLFIGYLLVGELPALSTIGTAMTLGCASYGISVVLDAYALRLVGAAREAAYFATAPFIGALAATIIVGESLSGSDILAMALMALGVVLLLRERHQHSHTHEAMKHTHSHVHDEHHQHEHGPGDPPGEPHAHLHRHEALTHDHPHVPDLHHRHRH